MTVPDTERRTRYAPLTPTLEFPVGFPIYDLADVAVYHDGAPVSGYEVTGDFVQGVSTNAKVVVDDAAGWVNVTVDIVGHRRPRRQEQFIEGRGVPAQDLNPAVDRLVASNRELYDRVERTLSAPPGETLAPMPTAGARAGKVLGFDGEGNPVETDLIGDKGWSPRFAVVSDSDRRVLQLVAWVGGEGAAPGGLGEFVGPTGMVATAAEAVNIRGATGASGAGTGDLLAENNLDDLDNVATARTNLGLGNAATRDVGTGSGDVAAGDHNHDTRYYTQAQIDGLASVYEAIGKYVGIDTKTENYSLVLGDIGKLLLMNSSSAREFTLPTNASVAWPVNAGLDFGRIGTGAVTVKGAPGVTVNGVSGGTVTISDQYGGATAIKTATNTWFIPNATAS